MATYDETRARVETHFSRIAARAAHRTEARPGPGKMQQMILGKLPDDLTGLRVLDAGCGTGQFTLELAARGADVVAVDIAPDLVKTAEQRLPLAHALQVRFVVGDMLAPDLGKFDYVVAVDSLIFYRADDLGRALAGLGKRTKWSILFTIAPRRPIPILLWLAGKLAFWRRVPVRPPHSLGRLNRAIYDQQAYGELSPVGRVATGRQRTRCLEFRV